ncbi:serine--tRNA ligase [Paenibacillus sp. NPDC058174]|uniref:serine--tRNA ligase n=1 Tax=Paenibacillus sp. NPDC058174 TaxID=3346366 RepID=UPI0036DC53A1
MLDIKWIRHNRDEVQETANQKGIAISVDQLLEWDDKRRLLLQEVERLRRERNEMAPRINAFLQQQDAVNAERMRMEAKELNRRLNDLEREYREADQQFNQLMLYVPNRISPDTPRGLSDQDNVEIKRVGEPAVFSFEKRDHVALGELHRMINIPRGVKTAGSRHYFLTGPGVLLHRAVQQLAFDLLMEKGFTPLEVPLMVRTDALLHAGHFPLSQDQTYKIEEEDAWLVGTSEVPLLAYFNGDIVDVTEPIRVAASSLCFRSEVGSAGKDVQGLYRVHQFSKVEQVVICKDSLEKSEELLQEITANAEELLQLLELPYRVMAVCTGDMSQKTYKQMDIETWMPSREAYGETHSSSNITDFQARRSNIRYRDADGKLRFCYTLNNTAVASPRILIPLLENHQEEDGSISIPQALRKYMNGIERLQV